MEEFQNKINVFVSVIGVMSDLTLEREVDTSMTELESALELLGLDAVRLVRDTKLVLAFQEVCAEFAKLEIAEYIHAEYPDASS